MPTRPISDAVKQDIAKLTAQGLTHDNISRQLGVSSGTVSKYKNFVQPETYWEKTAQKLTTDKPVEAEPISHEAIRKALKKEPLTSEELANALDCSPRRVADALAEMKARGVMLCATVDNSYYIADSITLPPGEGEAVGTDGLWTHRFGFTTDNHLCNRHSRLDVLNAAYSHFASEGITKVFNAGNWVDGEARFNRTELVTAPGMDNQLDYLIDKWPVHKDITTEFIAGDDHEGWYQQREGIEIGRYLQSRAEQQGRSDLKYLGYGEADVSLVYGSGSAVARIVHPGGGSAYAISYTDQKRVESYQGGEKPQLELVGHYHKFNHGYPREVHTIQGGCTCDQTMFMRKKRLQAHVGYSIVNIKQDLSGIITRLAVEWFPYFDRGFYEKRF